MNNITKVRLWDSDNSLFASIDRDCSGLVTIGEWHHHVHTGQLFSVNKYFGYVADSSYSYFKVLTGGKHVHLDFQADVEGNALVMAWVGSTYSASCGTVQTAYCNNRAAPSATCCEFRYTPAVSALGTNFYQTIFVGAGSKNSLVGGMSKVGQELELNINTDYLIGIQNIAGTSAHVGIRCAFYETDA